MRGNCFLKTGFSESHHPANGFCNCLLPFALCVRVCVHVCTHIIMCMFVDDQSVHGYVACVCLWMCVVCSGIICVSVCASLYFNVCLCA